MADELSKLVKGKTVSSAVNSAASKKPLKLPPVVAPAPLQLGVPVAPLLSEPTGLAEQVMPPSPVDTEAVAAMLATAATQPEPIITAALAPVAASSTQAEEKIMDTNNMNDTLNVNAAHKIEDTLSTAAHDATAKAGAFFNDANGRAKDAMAKGTKAIEELVEFSKGNLEALATSGRVAAKGAEDIAKYSAEYGRATIERANATAKQFAAVKSPTEFFQLQGDIAKQTLDALVAEGSKFTESYLKLIGEVGQPISNRVAVAVDKVKTTVAN